MPTVTTSETGVVLPGNRKLPPENTRFKPGQSGNPSGRPKKNRDLERTAEAYVSDAVKVLADALKDDDPKVRIAAANALLDRARGKPKQSVEVERTPHSLDEITTDDLIAAVHQAGDGEGASSQEAGD